MSDLNTQDQATSDADPSLGVASTDNTAGNTAIENQGNTSTNVDQGTSHKFNIGDIVHGVDGESTPDGHRIPAFFLGYGEGDDEGKILVAVLPDVRLVDADSVEAIS